MNVQYFLNGKTIYRNNILNNKQVNNSKKQNNLKNNRIKIDVPNPAPVDNTRVSPTKFTNYEKYKALLAIEGLWRGLLYIENANKPKPKPWYKEIFDWSTIHEDLFGLPNTIPHFKSRKNINR